MLGHGQVILFVHGFSDSWTTHREQMNTLFDSSIAVLPGANNAVIMPRGQFIAGFREVVTNCLL